MRVSRFRKTKLLLPLFALATTDLVGQWPSGLEYIGDLPSTEAKNVFDEMVKENQPWLNPDHWLRSRPRQSDRAPGLRQQWVLRLCLGLERR